MPDIKAKVDLGLDELKTAMVGMSEVMKKFLEDIREEGKIRTEINKDRTAAFKEADKQATEEEKTNKKREESLRSLGTEYEKWVKKLKEGAYGPVVGDIAQMASTLAPEQLTGLKSGLDHLKGSLLKELPFGGLVGLMMYGAGRDEDVRAMGATIGRLFQQTGDVGKGEMQKIGTGARELGVLLGKGPMGMGEAIGASASMFVQAGATIEDVLSKSNEATETLGGSILGTASDLDLMYQLGSGTSARMMGEFSRQFNESWEESATTLKEFGALARDVGTSISALGSSVIQSAMAVRVMNVDIKELAGAQAKYQELLKEQGFTKEFAAVGAQRAIGQVTQGMAGMSVGLAAVLGERMGLTDEHGQRVSGLGAYYAVMGGMSGKGQTPEEREIFGKSLLELGKMAKEVGGKEPESQRYFLQTMGFGVEGSKAILDISNETKDPKSLKAALEKHAKDLIDPAIEAQQNTNKFQTALLAAQDGLAKIGASILGAVLNMAMIVATSAQRVGMNPFSEEWAKLGREIDTYKKATEENWKTGVGGLEEIGGAGMLALKPILDRIGRGGAAGVPEAIETRKDAEKYMRETTMEALRESFTAAKKDPAEISRLLKIYEKAEMKPGHKGEEALKQAMLKSGYSKEWAETGITIEGHVGKTEVSHQGKMIPLEVIIRPASSKAKTAESGSGHR